MLDDAGGRGPSASRGVGHVFRALRYSNYRLFFIGQGISLIGTWMQQVAMSWLVYSLTNSAFMLGLVSFAGLTCTFLVSPFAGVLVDRYNRHRILVVTQALSMVQAFTLAAVVLTGAAAVWNLVIMSMTLGIINAFDMPTRQSFVLDMVRNRDDLGNAIALNSSLFNSARLIGPSVAGILVAAVGEGFCFLINGISFIAVIACLLAMKIGMPEKQAQNQDFLRGLKEGAGYVWSFPPIKYIILLLAYSSLVAMPYTVLMPVLAKEVLAGGANTMGFLMSAAGVGALAGAIYLASRINVLGLGRIIVIASGCFAAGLVSLSLSRLLPLSMLCMALTGFGMVVQLAACNTMLQMVADDDKRGRVMSFYVMSFMGFSPLGSLLFGGLASMVGAPRTLMMGGVACLFGGIIFAWRFNTVKVLVREAYKRKRLVFGAENK